MNPFDLTVSVVASGVKSGQFSCDEIAETFAQRVEKLHPVLNTHLYWDRSNIAKQTSMQQNRIAAEKDIMPLAGVPVVIKDNICTAGLPTTCASKILAGYKPPYSATVVDRLVKAGAIIFGKVNMDEFAMGSSNENSAFGAVKNPWDLRRVPGGSSGASAASVAAGLAPAALGSDTGGSIRQPASFCGVVGLKPTYGAVSRYGLVAFASSLDQIGPITNTVRDSSMLFDALCGFDPLDSTSSKTKCELTANRLDQINIKKIKIGVIKELFSDGLDPQVKDRIDQAVKAFENAGAEVRWISLPHLKYSISTYYILATAEASSNLARYDGVVFGHRTSKKTDSLTEMYRQSRSEGFGAEVKRRIMLGTFVLSSGYYDAFYGKAEKLRHMISRDFSDAFEKVDFLLSPTAPTTAFKLNEKITDPLAMYLSDIGTIAANLAGIPAISLPCGFDSNNLPIGLQLTGPKFSEACLLQGANWYEQQTEWHRKHPAL